MDVQRPDGSWTTSQEICYAEQEKRAKIERAEHEAMVLRQADRAAPISMYVMGMLSDAQEAMSRGMTHVANQIMNDVKLIIDQRMSTKDEHGRHDYTDAERARMDLNDAKINPFGQNNYYPDRRDFTKAEIGVMMEERRRQERG